MIVAIQSNAAICATLNDRRYSIDPVGVVGVIGPIGAVGVIGVVGVIDPVGPMIYIAL
jgi:hypothetical protein